MCTRSSRCAALRIDFKQELKELTPDNIACVIPNAILHSEIPIFINGNLQGVRNSNLNIVISMTERLIVNIITIQARIQFRTPCILKNALVATEEKK